MGTLPQEISQEGARKDLEDIQKVFDKYGVRLFVTYGALLGLVRDGNFIPYDDDIDLCVVDKIDYQTRKAIGHTLLDIGFTTQPIAFRVFDRLELSEPGYNGDEHSGIIVIQKRIRTTLFFFGEEECPLHGSCMVCHPKYKGHALISTPTRFFENPERLIFKGTSYLTPGPRKEYLEYIYGDTWKTPIKGKHARQWNEEHPGLENRPHE
jgi:phosphorylcholine metabolism protein LicD